MSERKKIDQLFQEKFQDFEVNPPEMVWTNIEEKLKEKKKPNVPLKNCNYTVLSFEKIKGTIW